MLEVYVPATSANIGPGYDCLGLCLDLFNKFTFEEIKHAYLYNCIFYFYKNQYMLPTLL